MGNDMSPEEIKGIKERSAEILRVLEDYANTNKVAEAVRSGAGMFVSAGLTPEQADDWGSFIGLAYLFIARCPVGFEQAGHFASCAKELMRAGFVLGHMAALRPVPPNQQQ